MEPATIRFTESILTRPTVSRWDVITTLRHFAIITYAVDPELIRPHVHPRFDLQTFPGPHGSARAWVSAVPFEDQDFCFIGAQRFKFCFGQTNYRTYVVDRESGLRLVWFFGTSLDSWSVLIPRHLWKLPWHRGRISFDCALDAEGKHYERYRLTTLSEWAAVELELEDLGLPVSALPGCDDLEAGLVILTHPLYGVFYRRDGSLGSYSIWHDRLRLSTGKCRQARFALFDRLGVVPFAAQLEPHSVLLQPRTEFTIYLPPRPYESIYQ
jgi:uncharacterized protein YqjF (DUF2071 family)